MKKIAISGCAGFLGSNLCKKLIEDGNEVLGIDNMITGDWRNMISFHSHSNFQFYPFDVSGEISGFEGVEQIYHLASPASPFDYMKYPLETIKANVWGTTNLLNLARKNKARILFSSTSEVYGDPLVNPQPEDYRGNTNCFGARASYDESKRLGETLMYVYKKKHNADIRVARLFNSFGGNMRLNDGRAIPAFFTHAIKNEDIPIFGDGTQTRSFTYVDDTIDGLIKLMNSDYSSPVNIGNDDEITLNQLVKEIIEITGSKSKIVYKDLPQDDPKQRRPDLTIAKEFVGWQPTVSRIEGLKKTYPYFKQAISKEIDDNMIFALKNCI